MMMLPTNDDDDHHQNQDRIPALTQREQGWRRDFPAAVRRPCQMGSPCQPDRHHHYYHDYYDQF